MDHNAVMDMGKVMVTDKVTDKVTDTVITVRTAFRQNSILKNLHK
jgi:hypothetical protein